MLTSEKATLLVQLPWCLLINTNSNMCDNGQVLLWGPENNTARAHFPHSSSSDGLLMRNAVQNGEDGERSVTPRPAAARD